MLSPVSKSPKERELGWGCTSARPKGRVKERTAPVLCHGYAVVQARADIWTVFIWGLI